MVTIILILNIKKLEILWRHIFEAYYRVKCCTSFNKTVLRAHVLLYYHIVYKVISSFELIKCNPLN